VCAERFARILWHRCTCSTRQTSKDRRDKGFGPVKDNPTMRHLQALARFFQVSPSYFFDGELTEFPEADVRLLAASRRKTLHRLAVTLLGLSDESLDAVLNLACRIRCLEGLPSAE